MSDHQFQPQPSSPITHQERTLLRDLLWAISTSERSLREELEQLAADRDVGVSIPARNALGRVRSGASALAELIDPPPRD